MAPGAVMGELRCCKPCLREGRGSEQRPQAAKVPLKDWVALSRKGDTSFGRIRAGKGNILNQCMSSCCLCICPLKLSCFQPGNPHGLGITSQNSCLGIWVTGA